VGGDERNFRRRLDQFKDDGVLWFAAFEKVPGRGRPAGLWALPPDVAEHIRNGDAPQITWGDGPGEAAGSLLRLQTWVLISVAIDRLPAFAQLIAPGELAAPASFVAQLDGERRAYLFVFNPAVGAQPAENLIHSALATDFDVASGMVRHVGTPDAAIQLLRTALLLAESATSPAG
jgi:hypothetical protein